VKLKYKCKYDVMSKENVRQPLVLLTTRIANYTSITSPKLEWQIHFSQFNKWCTGSPNKKKEEGRSYSPVT